MASYLPHAWKKRGTRDGAWTAPAAAGRVVHWTCTVAGPDMIGAHAGPGRRRVSTLVHHDQAHAVELLVTPETEPDDVAAPCARSDACTSQV